MTPSRSATPAAIASRTIVNAIGADARSSTSCSVRTCASARFLSTASTARRTAEATELGGTEVRTTYDITAGLGATGRSGVPEIDIGRNICPAYAVVSETVGVSATTPTIVSHLRFIGGPTVMRWPIGSWFGK